MNNGKTFWDWLSEQDCGVLFFCLCMFGVPVLGVICLIITEVIKALKA